MDIYGRENTYVEIHHHDLEPQRRVTPGLLKLAAESGLKTVAANDVHFLNRDDHEAHDVMICIGTGHLLIDENRMRYTPEVHFKTAEEMRALFAEIPGACDATLEIAERCNVELKLDSTSSEKYPQFDTPDGTPREEYLMRVCQEGLVKRYGAEKAARPEIQERLKYEVDTINQLGFASYFLITADFIQWARDHDIPVGPGRGSAAGSLASYAMGITDICPLQFGLLFERFLNPERVSPPDVDIDFCQSRRAEVIDYVRKKYGERSVSHIITYGTMGAKSVVRDVARVMGLSYGDGDRLSKLIDPKPLDEDDKKKYGGSILRREFDKNTELRELVEASTTYQELWQYALALEGLNRNVGIHAAGIVIGDRALDEHVPLTRGNEGEVVTQYDMGAITEVGLLKMDFLGLHNLTVIHEAVNHIRRHTPDFDIANVPLDDQPTFDILNRGETMGVFQLESGGMVETCRKYQIEKHRRHHRPARALPPGRDAVHRPDDRGEEGPQEGDVRASAARTGLRQHLRRDDLSGTGPERRQAAGRLHARRRRPAAPRHGQEGPEENGRGARQVRRGRGQDQQHRGKTRRTDLRQDRDVRGLRFQQVALRVLRPHLLLDGLAQGEPPGRVHGRAALQRNPQHRQDRRLRFRVPPHGHRDPAAGPQRLATALRAGNRAQRRERHPLRPGRHQELRRGRDGRRHRTNATPTAPSPRSRISPRGSIPRSSTSASSKTSSRPARSTGPAKPAPACSTASNRSSPPPPPPSATAPPARSRCSTAMDFAASRRPAKSAANETPVEEWSKDDRLAHEKELLGFYVTGHPLDKFRGVIDSERYKRLGLVEDLDISNPRERFPFAGMIRSIDTRVTKTGKPFGILVIEDFTGSAEIMLWGETFVPARDAGLLEAGQDHQTQVRRAGGRPHRRPPPHRLRDRRTQTQTRPHPTARDRSN